MSGGKQTSGKSGAIQRELVVSNTKGIHARPAAMFVKVANKFDATIFVEKDGETVNGKSIMGLMMLAAGPGCKIRVIAEGNDCTKAIDEIEKLLSTKFGEE
jgi:phosphocarrier protein HPr